MKTKLGDLYELPQETIEIDVEYYDENEKANLKKYGTADQINKIVSAPLVIPTPEFLTYYLFKKKRPNSPGLSTYGKIQNHIGRALSDLADFIKFNGHSIVTAPDIGYQDKGITEQIGESIGLSVVNRIHGLSEADWARIPESNKYKTFDYKDMASDGQSIIQVEAKGSSVQDNREKSGPIYKHKSNILNKKLKMDKINSTKVYAHPYHYRYGTITAVDPRQNGKVKCWITDPPPETPEINPKVLRLLNRMRFLRDWISTVRPRSNLAVAMVNRTAALEKMKNPFELDEVPLLKGSMKPFKMVPGPFSSRVVGGYPWVERMSHVVDGDAGGLVLKLDEATLAFLAVRGDMFELASKQSFETIMKFNFATTSTPKEVECHIYEKRAEKMKLPEELMKGASKSGGYYKFRLKGQVHYSSEGIVFGLLPI